MLAPAKNHAREFRFTGINGSPIFRSVRSRAGLSLKESNYGAVRAQPMLNMVTNKYCFEP